MTVELLYLPGCPHHDATVDLIREVLEKTGLSTEFTQTSICDYEGALKHSFPGSPTLRVNGRDIEDAPSGHLPVGFACRTYFVDGKALGIPPRAWLERAIQAACISEENHP